MIYCSLIMAATPSIASAYDHQRLYVAGIKKASTTYYDASILYITTWPRNTTSYDVLIIRTDVRCISTSRTLIAAAIKHSI